MFEEIEERYRAEELFADLIESAFLLSLIDGEQLSLAYALLKSNVPLTEH